MEAAFLPVALVLLAGHLARRTGLVPREHWPGVEALSFKVLIPAVLILTIARAEFSGVSLSGLVLAMALGVGTAGFVALAIGLAFPRKRLPFPQLTTLYQTTTRWNGFIALAAVGLLYGSEGLILLAIAFAAMIPLINVANIIVLSVFGSGSFDPVQIAKRVVTNPLVIGCAIGLVINLGGLTLPTTVDIALDMVGRTAIGIGVLAVGAGIELRRLFRLRLVVMLGLGLRLIVSPLLFVMFGSWIGLGPVALSVGIIVCSVPAATNGYIVAKQMGGDADLYADIMSWQIILSLVTLPVLLASFG